MPATATLTADVIKSNLDTCLFLGETLAADIPAAQFTQKSHPTINHPAFCYGHLAIYPDKVLAMLGMEDKAAPKDGYEDLFKAGVECVPQDGRYPEKDEIMAYYLDRHRALSAALPGADPERLAAVNPAEGRFREMCPTIGSAVNFLAVGHHMMHLGQVSSWRRTVGLGSAM
jgi:hypothetical protein